MKSNSDVSLEMEVAPSQLPRLIGFHAARWGLLVALGVVVEILFGSNTVPFFGNVIANITTILGTLGDKGLVGLVALGIILYLFHRKRVTA